MTIDEAYQAAAKADFEAARTIRAAQKARDIANEAEQDIEALLIKADEAECWAEIMIKEAKAARQRATDLHMASIGKQVKGAKDE
jgi:hypothetical protein